MNKFLEMKKLFNFLSSILFSILIISGCYENDNEIIVKDKLRSRTINSLEQLSANAQNVGQMHNHLLEIYLLKNKDCILTSQDFELQCKNLFINNNTDFSGTFNLDELFFDQMISSYNFPTGLLNTLYNEKVSFDSLITVFVSDITLRSMLIDFLHQVNEFDDNIKYNELEQFALNYYNCNTNSLTQVNQYIFTISMDVFLYSAKYWLPKSLGGLGKIDEYNLMVSKNCNTPIPRRRGWNFFGFVASDYTGLVASAATSVVASGGLSAVPNPALGGLPTASVIGCIGGGASSIAYTIGKKL